MKTLKNLLQEAADTHNLTDRERAAMRTMLLTRMRQHTSKGVVSPWMSLITTPRMTAFAVALLCIVGGSSSFAAQGALPGDILYPVKIHVNENLQVALASTPLEKITVQTHLADTRITEAETLALRGDLTPSTTHDLEENFALHASEALALSETISGTLAVSMAAPTPLEEKTDTEITHPEPPATARTLSAAKVSVSSSSDTAVATEMTTAPAPMLKGESETMLTATLKAFFTTRASIFEHLKRDSGATSTTATPSEKPSIPTIIPPSNTASTTQATSTKATSTQSSSDPSATTHTNTEKHVTPPVLSAPNIPSVINFIKGL